MKICKYCGSRLADSDKVCTSCGADDFYKVVEDNSSNRSSHKGHVLNLIKFLRHAPKKIQLVIGIGAVLLVLLLALNVIQLVYPSREPEPEPQPVTIGFKDIGELATQASYYTEIISQEDYVQFFNTNFNVPGTKRWLIASVNGIVKAGINFSEIEYSIDDANKAISIKLPEVKILSNSADHSSVHTWYEQLNAFNPTTFEQNSELFNKVEENGATHSIENGLMENALDNAKVLVESMCKSVLPDYTVIFVNEGDAGQ